MNQDLFNLNRWALLHDSMEAVTGDLPTPVKKHLKELKNAEHALMGEMGTEFNRIRAAIDSGHVRFREMAQIVSFSDSLEALSFLHTEFLLGNRAVSDVAREIRRRVDLEYPSLPFGSDMSNEDKERVWERHILPVIDGRVTNWPIVA